MTADLAEEHSTSTLATERLEAETADRLRLEKELQDTQVRRKSHVIFMSCCCFILQRKYVMVWALPCAGMRSFVQ